MSDPLFTYMGLCHRIPMPLHPDASHLPPYSVYPPSWPNPVKAEVDRRFCAIKDTARFCAIKAEVDRRRESGKTEEDRVEDALELFQGQVGKQFQFKHCWDILRKTRKWEDRIAGKATDSGGERDDQNADNAEDMDSAQEELRRPIGRDKAKKKRRNEVGGSSESSACLELFQQIARDREQRSLSQAAYASDMKEMQARQLALQEEKFRFRKQQWEAEQEKEIERIMCMDLSTLHGAARDYYARRQREIIQSRWGGEGNSNEDN